MRAENFRRVLDIQKQLQRAAEWRLHKLREEEHRLELAQQDLVAALSREDKLSMWLAPTMTRRLGSLAAEADNVAAAGERQAELVLEQTGRLKLAERLERALGKEQERAQEKSSLTDLVDLVLAGTRRLR